MKKGAAFQIASLVFLYIVACPWHPIAVLASVLVDTSVLFACSVRLCILHHVGCIKALRTGGSG